MSKITEWVAAGFAFLDKDDPGWWRADTERPVNLDALDFRNGDTCVLGQRCPVETHRLTCFRVHAAKLSGFPVSNWRDINAWAVEHGFQAASMTSAGSDALTDRWKRGIAERREAEQRGTGMVREAADIAWDRMHPDPYKSWVNGEPPAVEAS